MKALANDIRAMIDQKEFAALKSRISEMEIHDLTELLSELEGDELAICFRLLPLQMSADVFGDLPIERQEELISMLSTERVASILSDMPPDERTELLEELPGQLAQRLLSTLRGEEQQIARNLLAYPEESVGRLMTPEYVAVREDWTVEQVFSHLRQVSSDKETLNVIYVVDDRSRLLDELTLEQLVLAEPGAVVRDLMDSQVAPLHANDDREAVIDDFKKYDAVALPVVDSQGVLVGIVTHDDVLDVVEEKNTEDFQKITGMGPLEYSYFGTSFAGMLRKRLPWLLLLLVAQMMTTMVLTSFHGMLLFGVLVVFMPLVNSPAGNTGSQMAVLMIRSLAVQEINMRDWSRVLRRELGRGATMGVALGVMGFVAATIFAPFLVTDEVPAGQFEAHSQRIAFSVALAITLAVTLGNVIGSMLPFFFKRVGLDPAVTSGPFIASLMDVSGILIYFGIATGVLAALQ